LAWLLHEAGCCCCCCCPLLRLAEVHFKAIYPLQLLERLPEALAKCQAALQLLSTRKEEVGAPERGMRWQGCAAGC
jgi:hypothetical protein